MKLPNNVADLIKFFDQWTEEHNVTDPETKWRIWWAMFYAWKEGREWKDE